AIADRHELELPEVALEDHAPDHDEPLRGRRVGREVGMSLADRARGRGLVDVEHRAEVDRERPISSQTIERGPPCREHLGFATGGGRAPNASEMRPTIPSTMSAVP